jgi:hypothetical protein
MNTKDSITIDVPNLDAAPIACCSDPFGHGVGIVRARVA